MRHTLSTFIILLFVYIFMGSLAVALTDLKTRRTEKQMLEAQLSFTGKPQLPKNLTCEGCGDTVKIAQKSNARRNGRQTCRSCGASSEYKLFMDDDPGLCVGCAA